MPNKSRRNNQARHKQVASAGKKVLEKRRNLERAGVTLHGGAFRKPKAARG